ncbi:MAG: hypothetical protein HFE86_01900 [Clostridiales bacterium]|nr:hypothetical protein [Clostridiales bacterium]
MITVLPVEDKARLEALYQKEKLPLTPGSAAVEARDGEESLGYCLFEVGEGHITVTALTPETDRYMADGALRSALHVAVTRGIPAAYYADTAPVQLLTSLGFIKNDENRELDIGKLFSSCQNCGGSCE